ncbi:MAG: biotin/lipoyl-binding protein, partial [Oscillospiraceae bacterium]
MYKKKVYFLMFVFAAALCVPAVYMSTIQLSHGTCQQTAFYSDSFEVSGVIEPYTDVSVELSYPAYIQNVYVQKGSFVNQGQLLFTLDKKKMQQALNESQNSIKNSSEQASANMVQALPEEIYASEAGIISQLNVQSNSVVWQGSSLCTIAKSDN